MMAMEVKAQAEQEEILGLAKQIEDWRIEQGITQSELLRRHNGELPSSKPYKKIIEGNFSEMNLERMLIGYRSAWETIQNGSVFDDGQPLCPDTSTALKARQDFQLLQNKRSLSRVLLILGLTGSGKTALLNILYRKYASQARMMVCTRAVSSPMAFYKALLEKCFSVNRQKEPWPQTLYDAEQAVLKKIQHKERLTLFLDHAHVLSPAVLDCLIGLIDQTPVKMVIAAYTTLWTKLEDVKAYQQANQLTGNRLFRRIVLGKPKVGDVQKILNLRYPHLNGELAPFAKNLTEKAGNGAHLSYVREVCETADTIAEKFRKGVEVDASILHEAINEVEATR